METSSSSSSAAHLLLLFLLSHPAPSLLSTFAALALLAAFSSLALWLTPGGPAWGSILRRRPSLPGPRGLPIFGSLFSLLGHTPHTSLARLSSTKPLIALSLGSTPTIIASSPSVARDLLSSPHFSHRPLKLSARLLLFHRAIGFAPYGPYWRSLRRISSAHLFSPRRLSSLSPSRHLQASFLLDSVHRRMCMSSFVHPRPLLQLASINNIMTSVFGRRYDFDLCDSESHQLLRMIREGFELLGAFNWSDHLPFLRFFDFQGVHSRCRTLVAEVHVFVQRIVDEHRSRRPAADGEGETEEGKDFVDVLLSLQKQENFSDTDIIAILWEMIFRGTDTIAILLEWMLAEMVRNPEVQRKAQEEIDNAVGRNRTVVDSDIPSLKYVQWIVKETLRLHPPGPLLSWARLSTADTELAGHHIPAGTTAMVNMWAITHDAKIWGPTALEFRPERFMEEDIDVRGGDLRLAPFGAGRRVCPGRAMGLATVHLWAARLLQHFEWAASLPVDMAETLKLSCEMRKPLVAMARRRIELDFFANERS